MGSTVSFSSPELHSTPPVRAPAPGAGAARRSGRPGRGYSTGRVAVCQGVPAVPAGPRTKTPARRQVGEVATRKKGPEHATKARTL